jgi:5S rRNA maturation endonuclease (ribonuclease M5)
MRELSESDVKKLWNVIDELINASEDSIVVVEGSSDRDALREIGVCGEIAMASTMPDAYLVDLVGGREVIIMTDWDSEGKIMERKLSKKLTSLGIRVNLEYRRRIFEIVGRHITAVENLSRFIETLNDRRIKR